MVPWREMKDGDIPMVTALADLVHTGLVERAEVFAERQRLFPSGCLVLERAGQILGYAVSHPIPLDSPPALDLLLGGLPSGQQHYYLHDFVVAPALRGSGLARSGIEAVLRIGHNYPKTALISVYETVPFWSRFGFVRSKRNMDLKLAAYGEGAVYMEHAAGRDY